MTNKKFNSKTLGPISAKFVSNIKERGKSIFTLKEAEELLNKNGHEAARFISDLVKRKIVFRINKSIYLLLDTTHESTQLSNWPIIAKALITNDEYYISHYAAMRLHGMTTHAINEISITIPKRSRNKEIYKFKYHFIYLKPEYLWGVEQIWVSKQEKVKVSDLERTILDCLSKSDYCGGLIEIVRGIWSIHAKINWEKLIEYSKKYNNKASVKRLGFIAESLGIGGSHLEKLHEIIEQHKNYILLDYKGEKIGKFYNKWYIQINIENIKDYLNR